MIIRGILSGWFVTTYKCRLLWEWFLWKSVFSSVKSRFRSRKNHIPGLTNSLKAITSFAKWAKRVISKGLVFSYIYRGVSDWLSLASLSLRDSLFIFRLWVFFGDVTICWIILQRKPLFITPFEKRYINILNIQCMTIMSREKKSQFESILYKPRFKSQGQN